MLAVLFVPLIALVVDDPAPVDDAPPAGAPAAVAPAPLAVAPGEAAAASPAPAVDDPPRRRLASPAPAGDDPRDTERPKATAKKRLIVLDLGDDGGVGVAARTIGGVLSTALSAGPWELTTAEDLRASAGLEAQRQLLGECAGSSACMAEIAAALGADILVHGSIGRLGELYIVNLSMFDTARGAAIAREKVQAQTLPELGDRVEVAAARMTALYEGRTPPPPPGDDVAAAEGGLRAPLLVAGSAVGVLGAVAAVVGGVGASGAAAVLDRPAASRADKDEAIASWGSSTTLLVVGVAGVVVGGAVAATSLAFE